MNLITCSQSTPRCIMLKYFDLLFEPNEQICVTDSIFGTQTSPVQSANTGQFFCINALSGSRSDANVSSFRNILIEFDQGSISEQHNLILESKLPYTLITFSGNKSLHVIISLETPLANRAEYAALVHRLYQRFPTCDKSTKNPSRLSRTPGGIRDTGVPQDVVLIGERVPVQALEAFIGERIIALPSKPKPKTAQRMRLSTLAFLQFGAQPGQWNINLFKAAADLSRCGTPPEKVIELLENVSGYLDNKDLATIQSALKAVEQE